LNIGSDNKHSELLGRLTEGAIKAEQDRLGDDADDGGISGTKTAQWYLELQEDPDSRYV
jgi:hypothetical protein